MELERVLTKLKFDESVSGYALITSDGQPFLSFSLPDEVLPQIRGTLRIHGKDMKLVNTMTSKGTVILARVDPRWVLAVLFEPEFQLGGALSRTKAVVDLLVQVDLPPPPATIALEDEVTSLVEDEPISELESSIPDESEDVIVEETASSQPTEPLSMEIMSTDSIDESLKEQVQVRHGCVVHRGENYNDSMTLDSKLNVTLKREFANIGIDILLVVDEKMTVYKLAEHLARPVEKVIMIVAWCVSHDILWIECPEEQEPSQKAIIELPLFEGDLNKAKKQHRAILELCNGKRTLQEIATELGILYFDALQCIIPYRGKTVKFIRTDKLSRY